MNNSNRSNAGGNNFSNRSSNNNARSSNNNARSSNNNARSSNNNVRSSNNNARSSNNNASKSKGSSKSSSSTIFIIVAVILLVIILAVGGYFLYKHMNDKKIGAPATKQFIPYIHDASIEKKISNGSIPQSANGNEYNINFWIYVNDYTVRKDKDKCILVKGPPSTSSTDAKSSNPSVWLLKDINTFRVVVGIDTNYELPSCTTSDSKTGDDCSTTPVAQDMCDIENFPLQRWVNVNITLHDNIIDVFFDGKLKKSKILKGFPTTTTDGMTICPINTDDDTGGFNGYISNLKYSNSGVNLSTIEKMYKNGPTL